MSKKLRRNQIKNPTKEVMLLKKLRIEHALSIRKAAQRIGKSPSWLNHLETGRFDPRSMDLELVARFYGISLVQLSKQAANSLESELIDIRSECLKIIQRMELKKLEGLYAMIKIL